MCGSPKRKPPEPPPTRVVPRLDNPYRSWVAGKDTPRIKNVSVEVDVKGLLDSKGFIGYIIVFVAGMAVGYYLNHLIT